MKRYRGTLEGFFETGTEGVIWVMNAESSRWEHWARILRRFVVGLLSAVVEAACSVFAARRGRRTGLFRHWRHLIRIKCLPSGYDDMIFIREGDHLTVFGPDGGIVFDDEIVCNYFAGWQPYPLNPEYGQPCALGLWIHWTQVGWEPDEWAHLFMRGELKPEDGGGEPLRAILVRPE